MKARLPLLGLLMLLLGVCGCPPGGPARPEPLPPPEPTAVVIQRFNANNRRIQRAVYCPDVRVQVRLRDEQNRVQHFSGAGKFLFERPRGLYLDITHGLGVGVARFGSNDEQYWGWVQTEVERGWRGRYENLYLPRNQQMPLRPDHIIEALGMNELPTGHPGEMLWFRRSLDSPPVDDILYVRDLGTGQGALERQYWLSRRWPFMAVVIQFTDGIGRPRLKAFLDNYAPIGRADGPLATGRVTLQIGEDGSQMKLEFGRLEFRDAPPQAFRQPPIEDWPVGEVIDLDAPAEAEPR